MFGWSRKFLSSPDNLSLNPPQCQGKCYQRERESCLGHGQASCRNVLIRWDGYLLFLSFGWGRAKGGGVSVTVADDDTSDSLARTRSSMAMASFLNLFQGREK